MLLYENVFPAGDDNYERVFDTETKKSIINKIQIKPCLYVPNKDGDYSYFLNKKIKLSEVEFPSIIEYRKWMKNMDSSQLSYYGKTTPKYQYIMKKYYFDKNKQYVNNDHDMRTWFLDIEVKQDIGFPYPHEAKAEITLIQFYDSFDDKYYVIGSRELDGYNDLKDIERIKEYNKKYEFPENSVYIKASNEVDMMKIFVRVLNNKMPTIITAWNGDKFDFPYIVNRMKNLGLDENMLSPVGRAKTEYSKKSGSDEYRTTISGIYLIDLMDVYKKFIFTPQTSYSLNNIAKEELGASKVEYSEFENLDYLMEADYGRFVKYGIVDCILIKDIDAKQNLLNLCKSISYKMGICLEDSLGTVRPWGTYITNVSYSRNFILPNDGEFSDSEVHIIGAWVADPVTGKHKWIMSFDWASLYPSIIRWLNLSPETYIPPIRLPDELKNIKEKYLDDVEDHLIENFINLQEELTPLLKKYNLSCASNGSFYSREEVGLIPELIKQLYAERKASKKEMFVYSQLKEKIKGEMSDIKNGGVSTKTLEELQKEYDNAEYKETFFNTQQMTQKILLNSLYGALGNKHFVLFNNDIASAITGVGRFTNKKIAYDIDGMLQQKIKSKTPYLIYGDTDSSYFTVNNFVQAKLSQTPNLTTDEIVTFCDNLGNKVVQPFIDIKTIEIGEMLNVFEPESMAMDREIIADSGIFIAKKKYLARVLDTEGVRLKEPKKKVMGLEIVRSSTPMFCRKYLKEVIDILLDGDEEHLIDWVSKVHIKFKDAPIEEISRVSGVNNVSYNFYAKNGTKNVGGKIVPNYINLSETEIGRRFPSLNPKEILFSYFNIPIFYKTEGGIVECAPVPINSKASIAHNLLIMQHNLEHKYTFIKEKDKMKYCLLKTPNKLGSQEAFGYLNPEIITELQIDKLVDKDSMWERFFIQSLDIMLKPMGWSHMKKNTYDDWC